MALFTNAAFEEDEEKVDAYERESQEIREGAERLDGQWLRFQSRSPTPACGRKAAGLCDAHRYLPVQLPGTPDSDSDVEFSDDAGPFDMDDLDASDASILPAMRSWRSPSFASHSISSPVSFSPQHHHWGHSASSSLATSVSSFATSPRSRVLSLSKLAGLRSPELRSATEPRFDGDAVRGLTAATGLAPSEVSEGLGLGFGFAI